MGVPTCSAGMWIPPYVYAGGRSGGLQERELSIAHSAREGKYYNHVVGPLTLRLPFPGLELFANGHSTGILWTNRNFASHYSVRSEVASRSPR
jgi:hypothetical protein